ncbi:cytochrome b561, DM13 and DOMON domain-containing protein At5g54830 [Salvia hispanica]|uniref:cytochrome b561, DM13 and DOMON domain-containing protein At5g54830 n=1 Tax=Salvia hispanica TaxID=49212 RepID=UPI0020098DD5|nr:cytochrome b561, DM13 and DOMON domain-containing protein At5g54830 [Salvia hispanica]
MAPTALFQLGLFFIFMFLIGFSYSDPSLDCPSTNTSLLNFTSHFTLEQHQLRGIFSIINDCSFRVSQFDMLAGANVLWWGAMGDDVQNLTNGFPVSDSILNQTYKNDTFTVRLRKNVTWDQMKLLAVWDVPTASDFGYVLLNGSGNAKEQPTVFDNCKVLSDSYRIRWSLKEAENEVEIGLEAAVGAEDYMGFGWANESASGSLMVGGDVAITAFGEGGLPFAHDYYITKYSECMIDEDGNAQGVCPDTLYKPTDPAVVVNNTKMIYGHRKDGVSFIRYSRPLQSNDIKYDQKIDPRAEMNVIWAVGLIKPPDSLRPFYLPQNHGGSYGHLKLNLSEQVNDCLGPLEAEDKEDQDLVIADKKEPLVVTTGPALHYPNPPNPSKVLYINKKESPLLRVERGVPVKFSIQAGHDVALYVTSDPIGGNATLRNTSETIYFGGPEAEGVLASPTKLTWSPDRNTPDLVYYHSLYVPKMGWKVQVVDGGLPDMYNNSVSLDDQQVMLFWTLADNSISIAARGEKKSGYLAIGFGREMANSYAYVGWIDDSGKGRVNTYFIDGNDASSVHPTKENLTYVRCKSENGIITLEFTRPLNPSCDRKARHECNNIIDPSTPLKVIWAMGAQWSDDHLSVRNMHFITSKRPISVLLMHGSAEAEEDLRPVLAVHGFMMFLAWGILLPGGILAARYLKHVKDDSWFKIHVYMQYSGLAIIFLGFLFAVAELRGLTLQSTHVKFGMLAILLAVAQPINAYFRPKKPDVGEETAKASHRLIWEYTHVIIGRCGILVGVAALISGMKHLGERYGDENANGLSWALIVWFLLGALLVIYLEYRDMGRRRDRLPGRSTWVLGNGEEESRDLLNQSEPAKEKEAGEVQLEAFNR